MLALKSSTSCVDSVSILVPTCASAVPMPCSAACWPSSLESTVESCVVLAWIAANWTCRALLISPRRASSSFVEAVTWAEIAFSWACTALPLSSPAVRSPAPWMMLVTPAKATPAWPV